MAFNQKNVQKEGFRKSKFFFNHDVSSTYEFGECQPILCHLCATGQESHHIKMNSIVRMSPLVFPTFGRVVHKVTHHFVPFSSLWQHWDKALSDVDTSVTRLDSGNIKEQSYLPTRFPSIQLSVLMQILLRKEYSSYRFVGRAGVNVINNSWDNLNSSVVTDSLLAKFFYGDSTTLTQLQFVSVSDMDEYIDTTDPNTPQHLIADSADFSCMYHNSGLNVDVMLLIKLTTKGKRLFKVLTGLGYVPSFNDHTDVNLLPLFAFYKAYFDAYAIPQFQNYFVSNCYKCIDYINNQGTIEIKGDIGGFGQLANFESYFLDFILDLSECWYTENSDFVSSCLDAGGYLPSVTNSTPYGLKYPTLDGASNGYTVVDAGNKINGAGAGTDNMNNGLVVTTYDNGVNPQHNYYFDQITDDVLKAMYISVQRDSAIGFEIGSRLKARGFDVFVSDAKKYFLGTRSQPVQISDVMSTADTSNATLGAYAGKGVGIMYEDSVNFTNSELGYIISISTIYPISKVVNAVNPTHLGLDKFTFYNAQFDGLSYEQVPRNSIGHLTGTSYPAGTAGSRLFGFHPRYTGYKTCASNVLNGGFALRSEFQNWLPYTLDRVIIENYHPANNITGTAANPKFETDDISVGSSYLPSAGIEWRKVANSPWKGNYNRIFANGQILTEYINYTSWNEKNPSFDNFFVNTEIEHVAFASMLPIEDSWNAVDDEKPHSILSAKQ